MKTSKIWSMADVNEIQSNEGSEQYRSSNSDTDTSRSSDSLSEDAVAINEIYLPQEDVLSLQGDYDCYNEDLELASAPLTETICTSLEFPDEIQVCELHPENENLVGVCAGEFFSLWDVKTNSIVAQKKFDVLTTGFCFSYDGRYLHLTLVSLDGYILQTDNLEILRKSSRKDIRGTMWHPSRHTLFLFSIHFGIVLLSVPECKIIKIIEYEFNDGYALSYLFPTKDRVLGVFYAGKYCVWNVDSFEVMLTFVNREEEEENRTALNLKMNNSGTVAAYTYFFHKIRIISLLDGTVLAHIACGVNNFKIYNIAFAFSDDEKYLAAVNGIGEIFVFPTDSYQLQSKFQNSYRVGVMECIWRDHILFIAYADGYVRCLDINTGEVTKEYHCYRGSLHCFRFLKERNKFLTFAHANTIKIFSV